MLQLMATKIFTSDLRIGMFVADLDRPWVDTPFLLQGFLVEDEEQIGALRAHCEFVMVDRARSIGAEYEAPPAHAVGTNTLPPMGSRSATTVATSQRGPGQGVINSADPASSPDVRGSGPRGVAGGAPGRPVKLEDIARASGSDGA